MAKQDEIRVERIHCRMDNDVMRWVKRACKARRMTISVFVRMILRQEWDRRNEKKGKGVV